MGYAIAVFLRHTVYGLLAFTAAAVVSSMFNGWGIVMTAIAVWGTLTCLDAAATSNHCHCNCK